MADKRTQYQRGGGVWYQKYRLTLDGAMSDYREAVEAAIAAKNDRKIMERWQSAKKGEIEDFNRTKPSFDVATAERVPSKPIRLYMLEKKEHYDDAVNEKIEAAKQQNKKGSRGPVVSSQKKSKATTPQQAEEDDEEDSNDKEEATQRAKDEVLTEMQTLQRQYDIACAKWNYESRILQAEYDEWQRRKDEYVSLGRIVAAQMMELVSVEIRQQLKQLSGARDDHTGVTKTDGWISIPEQIMKKVESIMSNSAFADEADKESLQIDFQTLVANATQGSRESIEEYIMRWEIILEKGRIAYGEQFDAVFSNSIRSRYLINGCSIKGIKEKIENDAIRTGILEYPADFNEAKKMIMGYRNILGRIRNPVSGALYQIKVEEEKPRVFKKLLDSQVSARTEKKEKRENKASKTHGGRCYRCGQVGHRKFECENDQKCFKCGKSGHVSYDCRSEEKDVKKGHNERRARVNIVESAYIGMVTARTGDKNEDDDNDEGWTLVTNKKNPKTNVMKTLENEIGDLQDVILLDSGAEISVFGNEKLLSDIRETDRVLNVTGIGKEIITSSTVGVYAALNIQVYVVRGLKTNILSYSQVEEETGKEFKRCGPHRSRGHEIEAVDGRVIKFEKVNKLYLYSESKDVTKMVNVNFNVKNINTNYYERLLTKKEREKASTARSALENLNMSEAELKNVIRSNGLKSLDIDARDVENAVQLFGQNESYIQGRMTKRNNAKMIVPNQANARDVSLWIDIMYFWDLPFLIGVTEYQLVIATSIENKGKSEIIRGVEEMKKLLAARNHTVRTAFMDNEAGARVESFLDIGIILKKVSRNVKVGKIDAMIREVKRRVRSQLASCKYVVPRSWVKHMVKCAIGQINILPRDIDGYNITPREYLMGVKVDAKHFRIRFGDVCEVHHGRDDNTIDKKTTKCIALEPTMSDDYSWRFYDIESKSLRQSCNFTKTHVTDELRRIIARINPDRVSELSFDDRIIVEDDEHNPTNIEEEVKIAEEIAIEEPSTQLEVDQSEVRTMKEDNNNIEAEIFRLSYAKAKSEYKDVADMAAEKEIGDLLQQGTFEPIEYASRKADLPGFLFFKAKHDANGVFTKLKARFVAMGNKIPIHIYEEEDIASATPVWQHVMAIFAIIAKENLYSKVIDIPFSYLWASNHMGHTLICDQMIARIILKVRPDWDKYVSQDGKMKVKIMKSLYGLKESAKLWYNHVKADLVEYGFEENPLDECVFNKNTKAGVITLILYVDDIHMSCHSREVIEDFVKFMKMKYGAITESEYDEYTYLGMYVRKRGGEMCLSCKKYIQDIIHDRKLKKYATPALDDLFKHEEDDEKLSKEEAEDFHSMIAKMLYISVRIRVDILLAAAYLATRVSCPTRRDGEKLLRVLGYLSAKPHVEVRINGNSLPTIEAYVDASFGSHVNKKSHTGIFVTLGEGPILVKSVKQRIVSKSSTEAELNGLSLSVSIIIGLGRFLHYQGVKVKEIIIFQDNQSVLKMVGHGKAISDNTRHIEINRFFVKQYVERGEIKLRYKSTKEMTADALTKPLQGEIFKTMFKRLSLYECTDDSESRINAVIIKGRVLSPDDFEVGQCNYGMRYFFSCQIHSWCRSETDLKDSKEKVEE